MTTKPSILWVSDLCNSGYSNASYYLINNLTSDYDVYLFGINFNYKESDYKNIIYNTYPNISKNNIFVTKYYNNIDNYCGVYREYLINGFFSLKETVNTIKPKYIFSINDFHVIINQIRILEDSYKKWEGQFIAYMPIDYYNLFLSNRDTKIFNKIDKLIAYNTHGKNEYQHFYTKHIYTMPHIISPNNFLKLNTDIYQLRKQFLGEEFRDHFVILNNNVDNIRKNLEQTIDILFQLTLKKQVVLVIKTRFSYSENTEKFKQKFQDIYKKYNTIYKSNLNLILIVREFSTSELNQLYNCVDLGITTTLGEGWGLTTCEMILSGTMVLVPNNTSFKEIFPNDLLLDVNKYAYSIGYNVFGSKDKINNVDKYASCFYQSFHYSNYQFTISDKINIIDDPDNIINILITDKPINYNFFKYTFNTINDAISYIKSNLKDCSFQLFLLFSSNHQFFSNQLKYLENNTNIIDNQINRVAKQINFNTLYYEYKVNFSYIYKPITESYIQKIIYYIDNPNQIQLDALKMKDIILDICSESKNCNILKNILKK